MCEGSYKHIMKSFLDVLDWKKNEYYELFDLADKLIDDVNDLPLKNKSVVLFFPDSSIRTRITFELGIKRFGGDIITFPDSTLGKTEKTEDVVKYLQNWADAAVVRNSNFNILKEMNKYASIPIINAMTSENHPCEIIHDLYAIRKLRGKFIDLNFMYIGPKTNIANSWYNASQIFGFQLMQVCPTGYDIAYENEYFSISRDLDTVLTEADVIITDTIIDTEEYITNYQIDNKRINLIKKGAIFNPTPPFYRGGVISDNINLNNNAFVGYEFKKHLLEVQVAIICKCLL